MSSNHSHAEHGHSGHGHEHGHAPRVMERHCDVCVLDGSAAGLDAALGVVRQGRSVIVVAAETASGGLAAEIRGHGGEILAATATGVSRREETGDFWVGLPGGHSVLARQVISNAGHQTPDLDPAWPSANEADWDHRYSGDAIWSGNPNGTLVNEASGLKPGRALDVGAGEGGDAIWLAEQGWAVTASDVSGRALERVSAEAARRGLKVECLKGDANGEDPFGVQAFDLVSAAYASIPRTPDDRGVRNILNAVAPGGTLLIISHDMEAMRKAADPEHVRPFDPEAYVRVEDFTAALEDSPEWTIETRDKRDRPAGSATAAQHVHDLVLRARRRA